MSINWRQSKGRAERPGDILSRLDRMVFLSALFPEARLERIGDHIRVSGLSLGGVRVNLSEPVWCCAADDIGGGLLQLVSWVKTDRLDDYYTAGKWVRETFGSEQTHHHMSGKLPNGATTRRPKTVSRPKRFEVLETTDVTVPLNRDTDLWFIDDPISNIWEYRRASGDIASYIIRVEGADGKKILPLSYAYVRDNLKQETSWKWWLCRVHRPPLYKADEIVANPTALIVIVEGEKTADGAQALYEQHRAMFNKALGCDRIIYTTLYSGATSIKTSNLSPLFGRNALFFSDADEPDNVGTITGIDNMLRLIAQLDKVDLEGQALRTFAGIGSAKWGFSPKGKAFLTPGTDGQYFGAYPAKWDLADPIPSEKTVADIVSLHANAIPLNSIIENQPIWQKWKEVRSY